MPTADDDQQEATPTWNGNPGLVDGSIALPPRWRVHSRIGGGGQAEVFLALDAELEEWVAVKVMHPGLSEADSERLRREVSIGRALRHPNILRVHELIDTSRGFAVVLEWAPRGSLAARLRSSGPLPIAEAVAVAAQALSALAHLHERRLVHRDLKPSNLLVGGDGALRLADFGVARSLETGFTVTRTGSSVGTPRYMSPEALRGEPAAFPSDLYSLGVTLYELLTGEPPFTGRSDFDTAEQHLRAPVPDPRRLRPDCPRWLARFLARLLEKRPEDRWPSAGAALRAFERQRIPVSRRVLRRALLGGTVAAVAVCLAWAAEVLVGERPDPASARLLDRELVAYDARGAELWRAEAGHDADAKVLAADLVGDSRRELTLLRRAAPTSSGSSFELAVLGPDAAALRSEGIAFEDLDVVYPELRRSYRPTFLTAADTDGDGRSELLWVVHHEPWYPSAVGLWNLGAGEEPGAVLIHSGHVQRLAAGDLDGDGDQELVASAINNVLGYQTVLVVLEPRRQPRRPRPAAGFSPDLLRQWAGSRGDAERPVRAYTLLGQDGPPQREISIVDGRITVGVAGSAAALDRDGNPEGFPLHGRGPAARQAFWDELALTCFELQRDPSAAPRVIAALDHRHAAVLAEPPMAVGARLLLARSLGRGGDPAGAARVLTAAADRHPDEAGLRIALAEQLALGGRPAEAFTELKRAARLERIGTLGLRALTDLVFVAGALADSGRYDEAIGWYRAQGWLLDEAGTNQLRALWSFLAREWGDPSLAAATGHGTSTEAEVAVLWASLEQGADAAQVAGRARALRDQVEVRDMARCLEAWCLLREGRAEAAEEAAAAARDGLEARARESLRVAVWVPVAEWVEDRARHARGRAPRPAATPSGGGRLSLSAWTRVGSPPG
jgi:tetratricopeptide (TPR) repeat protein